MSRRRLILTLVLVVLSVLPSPPAPAGSVSAGGGHAVIALPSGALWAWGWNGSGQLGDGTTTARSTPTEITGIANVVAVAAGSNHTLILRNDGSVWACGANGSGQLGIGTTSSSSTLVAVPGLPTIAAIAAGQYHSVALGTDGSVWTWGGNAYGQLGHGDTTTSLSPLQVSDLTASAVAAGNIHTLVVKTDGTVWGFGANGNGQLGDNSYTQRTSPVRMGTLTSASAVAAGAAHSLVLTTSGAVYAVGSNTYGELGDGGTTTRTSPVSVSSLSNVASIAAAIEESAAVMSDGTVCTWGRNTFGQLGDGTTTPRSTPASISGLSDITAVEVGDAFMVAVSSDGAVWAWGYNGYGQIGDGTNDARYSPVLVADSGYAWKTATPTFWPPPGSYAFELNVSVAVATAGAEIHYTLNGNDPTTSDPTVASGGTVSVTAASTLKAKAWKNGLSASNVAAGQYALTVAIPTLYPYPSTYTSAQTVTLSESTAGATVHYTTDGSTPTDSSTAYTGPILVGTTTTIKAAGFKANWMSSAVNSGTYTMNFGTLSAPTISPSGGSYVGSVSVTLASAPDASVRYTTDGSTPTSSSTLYTQPIDVTATSTVKAMAFHPDYAASGVSSASFTVQTASPTFDPPGGTYLSGQAITVSTVTSSAVIRYTTNGADPTTSDPVIANGGSIVVGGYTLKAAAWKTGQTTSDVTTAVYAVTGSLTSPAAAGGGEHSLAVRADGVPWAWGSNSSTQVGDGTSTNRSLPVTVQSLSGVVAVAAGDSHSLALRSDGTVWSWGANGSGQLGDATTTNRSMRTPVSNLTSVVQVAAGYAHSVALRADGTVWAWGANFQGQLGDGTTAQHLTPVAVSNLSGVTAIAAGNNTTLALKGDGTVWAWGANAYGQIGDGTTTDRPTPTRVGTLTGITAIAAGGAHGLAVQDDGTIWAWGFNMFGQLGDGTLTQRTSPVHVTLGATVTHVRAGTAFSLALTSDGGAWSWGNNSSGQLGDGTTTDRSTPAALAALPAVVAIGAGSSHALAITEAGVVWTWGRNASGQLGDGGTAQRATPAPTSTDNLAWQLQPPSLSLSSGTYTTTQSVVVSCLDATATLHYTTSGSAPTADDPVVSNGGSVSIDANLTLQVSAWKPGYLTSTVTSAAYVLMPVAVSLSPASGSYASAQSVTMSTPTTGATIRYTLDGTQPTESSSLYAGPVTIDHTATVRAVAFRTGWSGSDPRYASYWISAGTLDTPVISPTAGSYAAPPFVSITSPTGTTIRYTLDGSLPSSSSPVYVYPFTVARTTTVKARAFKVGYTTSAAATVTYTLDAAGAATAPTLQPSGGRFTVQQTVTVSEVSGAVLRYTTTGVDPTETDTEVPANRTITVNRSMVLKVRAFASGLDPSLVSRGDFIIAGSVAAGWNHALALAADGTVWAWGLSGAGQVGDGTQTTRPTPVSVLTGAIAIAAGQSHSLAVQNDGSVRAWGSNSAGQIGDGTTGFGQTSPTAVTGLTDMRAVAGGQAHSLALKGDGTVWAWGSNATGQLGDGTVAQRLTPVQVLGLTGALAIAAGETFSVALETDGARAGYIWAWGDNTSGQLGDGTTTTRSVPVLVLIEHPVAIAAGRNWAMALDIDGAVWTWGGNASGQLRDGTKTSRSTPQRVPGIPPMVSIAAGTDHALAVDASGRLWAWGENTDGELGAGEYGCSGVTGCTTPAPALVAPSGPVVAGGRTNTFVVTWSGDIVAFGASQLGNGATSSLAPVTVTGLSLADNSWLTGDADGDGLSTWREYLLGTDPLNADTNGNGIADATESAAGTAAADPDCDHDGVPNWVEIARGTDPFNADTDGDSVGDAADAFPLDPTRSAAPSADPNDHTAPVITLLVPTNARRIGG